MSNKAFSCQIKGLDALVERMEKLASPEKCASALSDALDAGGAIMQKEMIARVPKDTDFLAEHINVKKMIAKGKKLAGAIFVGPAADAAYPKEPSKK